MTASLLIILGVFPIIVNLCVTHYIVLAVSCVSASWYLLAANVFKVSLMHRLRIVYRKAH